MRQKLTRWILVLMAILCPTIPLSADGPLHTHNGRPHSHPLPVSGLAHQHNGRQSTPSTNKQPLRFREGRVDAEPRVALLRGGTFVMGSPSNERGRDSDEKQHSVTVGDFGISTTEVSLEQYHLCVRAGGCKYPIWFKGSAKYHYETGSSNKYKLLNSTVDSPPIIGINWQNANDFTEWLSRTSGETYRLPTEAEWEYAARAGTASQYYWGHSVDRNKVNYGSDTCCSGHADAATKDNYVYLSESRSFRSNSWGIFDMAGNVSELTCSAYDKHYSGAEKYCVGRDSSAYRAVRGGNWESSPIGIRHAERDKIAPRAHHNAIGFRVVLETN